MKDATTDTFSKTAHVFAKRSLAKTISWRIFASLTTFIIAYIATGKADVSATIVSAEIVSKLVLYYLHERGWAHIRWGLK